MKKYLVVFVFITLLSGVSFSQQYYKTAIGLRGGSSSGLTAKHAINNTSYVEGIISSRWSGIDFAGLYEIHAPAFNTPRLNWYYGGGAHVGLWTGSNADWADEDKDYFVIGAVGIIGMEYNLEDIPFCISLDWKPTFNLIGYSGLWLDEGAFSVRYSF